MAPPASHIWGQRVTSANREGAGWLTRVCGGLHSSLVQGYVRHNLCVFVSGAAGQLLSTNGELGGSRRGERPGAVMDTAATATFSNYKKKRTNKRCLYVRWIIIKKQLNVGAEGLPVGAAEDTQTDSRV